MQPDDPIVCRRCRHYFITWDARHPHGCRAMNFKSRRPPSRVVRSTSGRQCLRYAAKNESDHRSP
jgi:hypothetical protein